MGPQATQTPNFIFILADDLGYSDLGHDGSGIATPHIDRLAREGAKLTQFYATAPYCSPTRASLLTGRYPYAVGVPYIISAPKLDETPQQFVQRGRLSHDAITLPQVLARRGYATMLAGKWHLGYEEAWWPRRFGFHRFWGSLAGTPGYFEPVMTYDNETAITVRENLTDGITSKSVEFIREHCRQPFFILLSYNAPHCGRNLVHPREAPPELIAKYRKVFTEGKAGYAATIERMDSGIGEVLRTLDELNLARNTVVIFTSDNGPCICQGPIDRARSAAPLRGHKYTVYEGGIRVPCLVRWPLRIPAGRKITVVAAMFDWFPTIADLAGCSLDVRHAVDGQNIVSLLAGNDRVVHDQLHWDARHAYGVRRGDWKLVQNGWEAAPRLFDLRIDPGERDDIAPRHSYKVNELVELHAVWRKRNYPDRPPLSKARPVWWEDGRYSAFPNSR
jgi:arylsulfatase A-like enzyme